MFAMYPTGRMTSQGSPAAIVASSTRTRVFSYCTATSTAELIILPRLAHDSTTAGARQIDRATVIRTRFSSRSARVSRPRRRPRHDLDLRVLPASAHGAAMVLSSSIREQVAELLAAGNKILAVKLVREQAGVTLLEAKTIV